MRMSLISISATSRPDTRRGDQSRGSEKMRVAVRKQNKKQKKRPSGGVKGRCGGIRDETQVRQEDVYSHAGARETPAEP